MRTLLAMVLCATMTGCYLIRVDARGGGKGSSAAALEEEKCPPGHRWSDGKCHDTGKGNDPDKKKGGKGKP